MSGRALRGVCSAGTDLIQEVWARQWSPYEHDRGEDIKWELLLWTSRYFKQQLVLKWWQVKVWTARSFRRKSRIRLSLVWATRTIAKAWIPHGWCLHLQIRFSRRGEQIKLRCERRNHCIRHSDTAESCSSRCADPNVEQRSATQQEKELWRKPGCKAVN